MKRTDGTSDYSIAVEDDGKIVSLNIHGTGWKLHGSADAMRLLRDGLTRAIVCAEVMQKHAPTPEGGA
jgi:hypothetical protein